MGVLSTIGEFLRFMRGPHYRVESLSVTDGHIDATLNFGLFRKRKASISFTEIILMQLYLVDHLTMDLVCCEIRTEDDRLFLKELGEGFVEFVSEIERIYNEYHIINRVDHGEIIVLVEK